MSKVLQLKRGNTAKNNAYTGAVAELTVDTEAKTLRLHDGSTAGGVIIAPGGEANVIEKIQLNGVDQTVTSKTVNLLVQTPLSSTNKVSSMFIDDTVGGNQNTHKFVTSSDITNWNGKQEALVSGTNIKTINNTSLLGSGNISIDSLPIQTDQSGKFLTTNGISASWSNAVYTQDNLVAGTNIEIVKKINPNVIDQNTFALFHYKTSAVADAGVGSTYPDFNTSYTRATAHDGQLSLVGAGMWASYTFVEVIDTVKHFGQNVGQLRGVDSTDPRLLTIDRYSNSAGYNFSGYITTGAMTVDVWAKSDYDSSTNSVVAFSLAEQYDKTRAIKFRKNSATLYADASYDLQETNVLKTETLTTPIVFSDWNHYAFTYVLGETTGKCYGYVNGKCVLSYTDTTPLNVLRFGCSYSDIPLFGISTGGSSNSDNAYLQELRVTFADCYSGQDFDVPTEPYTEGSGDDVYQINNTQTAPSVMTGATSITAGTSGLVPAPAAGDQAKYLTGAGTWEQPSGLQNTATGTGSLTILGTSTSVNDTINIGSNSSATQSSSISIGTSATVSASSGVAIGRNATVNSNSGSGIAIGYDAKCNGDNYGSLAIAIGCEAQARHAYTMAIGEAAVASAQAAIAFGGAAQATAQNSLQIGQGTNSTTNTVQIDSYQVFDRSTGKIPMARLPIVQCTQAEYDALVQAGTVDANTLYFIIPGSN